MMVCRNQDLVPQDLVSLLENMVVTVSGIPLFFFPLIHYFHDYHECRLYILVPGRFDDDMNLSHIYRYWFNLKFSAL